MGLTIHYSLAANRLTVSQARAAVAKLRQRALDLPYKEVGDLIELSGDDCDFNQKSGESSNRWLLVQAAQHINLDNVHFTVSPKRLIAFSAWPGEGCEQSNFGLCQYPGFILIDNPRWPFGKKRVATGFKGWSWSSFCKTQYASNPECGGVEHFLRCHLSVITILDRARELGILADVSDEGEFWTKRDVPALVKEVGVWNAMLAGAYGVMKDAIEAAGQDPRSLQAAISEFPNFEHLEATGRTNETGDE